MLDKEQFLTVVSVPNLLTHVQLLNSELDVVILVDSQIWFAVFYFRVTISFLILVRYGHFDHLNFIQSFGFTGMVFYKNWESYYHAAV